MARAFYVVVTTPTAGQDEEFNRWYDDEHLDDVLKVPGFVAAQRFRLVGDNQLPGPYLALYEVETDDPAGITAKLQALANTEAMPLSAALDMEKLVTAAAVAITPRRTAAT